MKSVNINRSNGIVTISVTIDIEGVRKSQLYISDEKASSRFNNVLTKIKTFSKFKKLSLSYGEIDYYDNLVDVYHTPYVHFTKGSGKRKPTVSHCEHGCIPKYWNETFNMSLEDPKTIKPIEVFLSQFNIKLSAKQIREVRKAMKGEGSFWSEI